jgi:hypothetical protein
MNWKIAIKLLLKKILILKDMKKSNKLLIAFASALILIPLLGMVYVSQVKYKTGSYDDSVDVVRKVEDFSTPTKDMESKTIATAFESINIGDAKNLSLYINIIKDDKYGAKVPNELKDSIDFTVDASGTLQITLKNKLNKRDNNYKTIWIYMPTIKNVNVAHAEFVYLDVNADSLALGFKDSRSIVLNKDITLNALSITTDSVKSVELNKVAVKSLNVHMNGGSFNTTLSSYDNVAIKATGKSEIELYGTEDVDQKYLIKNLVINTLDEATFKVKNIKVENCSGSFSDQTKVQMSAVNLNQMFRK